MKNIVSLVLILVSSLVFSQTDSTYRNLRVTSTTLAYAVNMPRAQIYYQPSPYVNLRINTINTSNNRYDSDDRKKAFTVLFLSGLAFTTAAILEGDYNYGTYRPSPNTTSGYNTTYTTKSFWQQTPRQIMLCVGVGFTLVGGIGMVSK